MPNLRYLLSLPRRWWHRHGFNVQSPWAYEFVRDAISDKSWFYAFDEMDGSSLDRQLFRMVYWLKASDVVAYSDNLMAKAHLVAPISRRKQQQAGITVYYYDKHHLDNLKEDIKAAVFNEKSCIILEDIRHTASDLWHTLVCNLPTTSTFDLPNRGVALFDTARQKQNYYL